MDSSGVLLIHLGGLGDVCLSESIFFSLQQHFGNTLIALGNRRFLDLFSGYFLHVEGIESRKWLPLFSDLPTDMRWERIVFIGKDKGGSLRRRWRKRSIKDICFIDMYPDDAFPHGLSPVKDPSAGERVPIEDYQLAQLALYGVKPLKRSIAPRESARVILYPEEGIQKMKWSPERFLVLYEKLKSSGVDTVLLGSLGLPLDDHDAVFFEGLEEVKDFFNAGGIFVSNDSGMAHLAGSSGLFCVTIFCQTDPQIWRPRGSGVTVERPDVEAVMRKCVEAVKRGSVNAWKRISVEAHKRGSVNA